MAQCDFCKNDSIGCLVFEASRDGSFGGSAHRVCRVHVNNSHPVLGGTITFVSNHWVRDMTTLEIGVAIAGIDPIGKEN
jgi:hypothetical protein